MKAQVAQTLPNAADVPGRILLVEDDEAISQILEEILAENGFTPCAATNATEMDRVLAQGGVAYYLHRKSGITFLSALSSVLFIAMLEIYQLFMFSTVGVIFYTPVGDAQTRIVAILRIVYIAAWALLAGIMTFFAIARRRRCFEAAQQPRRAGGNFIDGIEERRLIGSRRFVETGDLPHKLQGGRLNLIRRYRRIKVEKCSDVPAHGLGLPGARPTSRVSRGRFTLRPATRARKAHERAS